ncbi:hypothetical protein QO206_03410 [Leeuwenhoekiella aequorea]|uniref:hypothetical protein n=1 Tax=Leeuwenhoekiella aequorea TaxID=283736 RepID=UPI00352C3E4B|tara:strand:+ start:287 stop:769 length:483 start_codon:yes stop_codon:yes gene_type:complete
MKKGTIDNLKKLKLGERLSSYKPLSEEEKELQNTLSKLKNFGILSLNKNSYSVLNFKLLSKFIELQDFEKLAEYIENPNELENGIKSIVNNGILIQDSRLEKSPIKQNINPAPKNNPEKKSLFNRIYSNPWVIGISLIIIAAILGAERIKDWIDKYINGL